MSALDERTVAPRRTARYTALGVAAVVAALLAVLATRPSANDRVSRSPLLGKLAPDFSGPSVVGNGQFALADHQNQFVVLNFFASYCVPCAIEHPELDAFQKAHAKTGDATLVSVVFQDQIDDVKAFFARRGGNWPVLDSDRVAVDYGVTGVPETYLIAPQGVVVAKWNGSLKKANIEKVMAQYLGQADGGSSTETKPGKAG